MEQFLNLLERAHPKRGGPLKKLKLEGDRSKLLSLTFKADQSDFTDASYWCEGQH